MGSRQKLCLSYAGQSSSDSEWRTSAGKYIPHAITHILHFSLRRATQFTSKSLKDDGSLQVKHASTPYANFEPEKQETAGMLTHGQGMSITPPWPEIYPWVRTRLFVMMFPVKRHGLGWGYIPWIMCTNNPNLSTNVHAHIWHWSHFSVCVMSFGRRRRTRKKSSRSHGKLKWVVCVTCSAAGVVNQKISTFTFFRDLSHHHRRCRRRRRRTLQLRLLMKRGLRFHWHSTSRWHGHGKSYCRRDYVCIREERGKISSITRPFESLLCNELQIRNRWPMYRVP